MISTDEDVKRFGAFLAAGGLKEARNLTKGKKLKPIAEAMIPKLDGTISAEVPDYMQAVELVATIRQFSSTLGVAVSALGNWNSHLVTISDLTDLEQVSIGVSIICKMSDIPDDKPTPATKPIVNKEEIDALEVALIDCQDDVESVIPLMAKVNTELTPVGGGSGDSGGGTLPPAPPPEMEEETIAEVLAMNEQLKPLITALSDAVSVVNSLASEAKAERIKALDMFNQAVLFTIGKSQLNKPSISDATADRFPDV